RHGPAGHRARFRPAGGCAGGGAGGAELAIAGDGHALADPLDRAVRADGGAIAAQTAAVHGVKHLGSETLAFRIVTPPAGQWAALEKHRCADAGPVVQRKPHDMEDHAGGFGMAIREHRTSKSVNTVSRCLPWWGGPPGPRVLKRFRTHDENGAYPAREIEDRQRISGKQRRKFMSVPGLPRGPAGVMIEV